MMKNIGNVASAGGFKASSSVEAIPAAPDLTWDTIKTPDDMHPTRRSVRKKRQCDTAGAGHGRPGKLFGLTEAPTFRPTWKQWQDPMKYVQSIREEAEKSGLIKIVPPKGWRPEFALDPKTFWFSGRIMPLNTLSGQTRMTLNYLDQLQTFHAQCGSAFTRVPILNGRAVNLHALKQAVAKRGGFDAVCENRLWADIGRECGAYGTSVSNSIRSSYQKWVLPYEEFLSVKNKKGYCIAEVEPMAETEELEWKPGDVCEVCFDESSAEKILLCDQCNRGFHTFCLRPRLLDIPQGEWLCPHCLVNSSNDYGFEEAPRRSLEEFHQVADYFKAMHFHKRGLNPDNEEVVENEFWRLVNDWETDVEVEYGADLHSATHGSGFPTKATHPESPYATCPWNLTNMPHLPNSLLHHIPDIPGMTIPWLYVGMCFATFCWHVEDHWTPSINYLHWGATKTWYGIPASEADKFENVMREECKELFEGNRDLLFHLTTLLSPEILKERGVEVVGVNQRPGEFVITFPRAYHAGFNQGFNLAEAVNFATADWLPYGLASVKRYWDFERPPVFCHEELVIECAQAKVGGIIGATHLREALQHIIEHNANNITAVEKYVQHTNHKPEKAEKCSKCHGYCFIACVFWDDPNPEHQVSVCLDCWLREDNPTGPGTPFQHDGAIVTRYSINALQQLSRDLDVISKEVEQWKTEVVAVLDGSKTIPLDEVKRLRKFGEQQEYHSDELNRLEELEKLMKQWRNTCRQILFPRSGKKRLRKRAELEAMESSNEETTFLPKRDVENIRSLVDFAQRHLFGMEEVELMKDFLTTITDFQRQAAQLLSVASIDADSSHAAIQEMISAGEALQVEGIPEIPQLVRLRGAVEWIKDSQRFLADVDDFDSDCLAEWSGEGVPPAPELPLSYHQLLVALDEAKELGLKAEHSVVAQLKARKHLADELRVRWRAMNLSGDDYRRKGRKIKWEDVDAIVREAWKIASEESIWEEMWSVWWKCRKWLQLHIALSHQNGKPQLEVLSLLLDQVPAGVEIAEAAEIRKIVSPSLEGEEKMRKCLGIGPKSTLAVVERKLADVVGTFERMDWVMGLLKTGEAVRDLDHEKSYYCTCLLPDSSTMIACESCHEWYHVVCIGLSKKILRHLEGFVCFICQGDMEPVYAVRKITLADVEALSDWCNECAVEFSWTGPIQQMVNSCRTIEQCVQSEVALVVSAESGRLDAEGVSKLRALLRVLTGSPVSHRTLMESIVEHLRRNAAIIDRPLTIKQEVSTPTRSPPHEPVTPPDSVPQTGGFRLKVGGATEECPCQQGSVDDNMVGCDECGQWYHFGCVGLEKHVDVHGHWACAACSSSGGSSAARIPAPAIGSQTSRRKQKLSKSESTHIAKGGEKRERGVDSLPTEKLAKRKRGRPRKNALHTPTPPHEMQGVGISETSGVSAEKSLTVEWDTQSRHPPVYHSPQPGLHGSVLPGGNWPDYYPRHESTNTLNPSPQQALADVFKHPLAFHYDNHATYTTLSYSGHPSSTHFALEQYGHGKAIGYGRHPDEQSLSHVQYRIPDYPFYVPPTTASHQESSGDQSSHRPWKS
ncbi:hypothetical protein BC832DRAFT_559809 [Gaertneriomyces semiglobifer]|nr:hypothetical protein BC832DRAFT_559809 [Gaertneriomyces semiglobifer]